jgi:hypothetical protein
MKGIKSQEKIINTLKEMLYKKCRDIYIDHVLEHDNVLLSDLYRRNKERSLIEARLLEDLLSNFLPDGDIICRDIQDKAYAEAVINANHKSHFRPPID